MLTVENFQPSYVIAPDVYITSAEILKVDGLDRIKIYYRIYDQKNNTGDSLYWSNDEKVLNSVYAYVGYGDKTSKISLKSLKPSKKNIYESHVTFDYTSSFSSSIVAYCGNDEYRGKTTTETLEISGVLEPSNPYISKVKDLRLIDVRLTTTGSLSGSNSDRIIKDNDLYVSYATDKKIKIGVVFDLNAYLLQKSENYKLLSAYGPYRSYVLDNSSIDLEKSSLYLTNLSTQDNLQKPCKFKSNSKRVDNSSAKYICTFYPTSYADGSPIPANKFNVKLKINVKDASKTFFNDNVIERISYFRSLIEVYHSKIVYFDSNNLIDDPGKHYYTFEYDKKVPYRPRTSAETLNTELYKVYADAALEIGELTSIFSAANKDSLIKLYSTILHPLTTSAHLLSSLLSHIERLYTVCLQFTLLDTNLASSAQKDDAASITMEFGSLKDAAIDLTYDAAFGYEVVNTDSYDVRIADMNEGFYTLSTLLGDDLNIRRYTEAGKYFNKPTGDTKKNINTYAISMLDLGDFKYNLVDASGMAPDKANEAYVYMKEAYRLDKNTPSVDEIDYSFTYKYGKIGTIVYDIASNGVSIENIANRNNGGNNNLEVNTLFDNSSTKKDISLKYIVDTGVQKLYFLLDNIRYNNFTAEDAYPQAKAAQNTSEEGSKYPLTDSVLQDPEAKAKNILLYDSIFEADGIITGSNYSLYRMKAKKLNPVFSGIRSFNEYYLVHSGTPFFNKTIPASQESMVTAMMSGKPAEIMLRNSVQGPSINIVEI